MYACRAYNLYFGIAFVSKLFRYIERFKVNFPAFIDWTADVRNIIMLKKYTYQVYKCLFFSWYLFPKSAVYILKFKIYLFIEPTFFCLFYITKNVTLYLRRTLAKLFELWYFVFYVFSFFLSLNTKRHTSTLQWKWIKIHEIQIIICR